MKESEKSFLHRIFRISLLLKGIDSLLEIIGGLALFFIKPELINNFFRTVFQHELLQDPNDLIGNFLINFSSSLSFGSIVFGAIYLLIHGILKLSLIIGLWKRITWTYIAAEIVFIIFIFYQTYRFTFTQSVYLIFLNFLDIIIIILTWWEYKQLKRSL